MKCLKSWVSLFFKDERGNVLILVAVLMIVLLGVAALAVDAGELYMVRRQMVNATDAAALAGAQELIYNPDNVEAVAKDYAITINGADDDERFKVDIIGNDTVAVEAGRNVDLSFARFLGQHDSYVSSRAVAKFSPLTKGIGLAPFAVVYDQYEAEQEVIIKFDHHEEGDIASGNYHILDFDEGKLRDNVRYGTSQEIDIGDWIATEPGQSWGQVRKPLQERYDLCGQGPGDNWNDEDGKCECCRVCERVMHIIIFDEVRLKQNEEEYKPGKTEIRVYALAAVYLLERPGNPEKEVRARFIETIGQSEADESIGTDPHGLYKVKLIE